MITIDTLFLLVLFNMLFFFFFFSSRRRHTRCSRDWSSDVCSSDLGGDENAQLYYYAGSGAVRALTKGKFLHGSPVWSNDGKRVAFYGNERDGASYDIYVVDVTDGSEPRLVAGGQRDTWYPLDWSAGDRQLLLWKYVSINEGYLYLADVATGSATPLEAG